MKLPLHDFSVVKATAPSSCLKNVLSKSGLVKNAKTGYFETSSSAVV
jgi:hypothetical protein